MEKSTSFKEIAVFIALSSILQIFESFFPHPIPGLKIGLANMVTLVVLVKLGFISGIEVSIFRTILSSLILGTFISPGFIMSITGALASTLVMGFLIATTKKGFFPSLSLIGISIAGALTHNLTQLFVVFVLFIKHSSILWLFPWLGAGSILTGYFTGVVSIYILRKIKSKKFMKISCLLPEYYHKEKFIFLRDIYIHRDTFIHRINANLKFFLSVILFLISFISTNRLIPVFILFFILSIYIFTGLKFSILFKSSSKLLWIIVLSVFVPLLFTGGDIIYKLGHIKISLEGFNSAVLWFTRVMILIVGSQIVMQTTKPDELMLVIRNLLLPFKIVGVNTERFISIMNLSWKFIPLIKNEVESLYTKFKYKKIVKKPLLFISLFFILIYRKIEKDLLIK